MPPRVSWHNSVPYFISWVVIWCVLSCVSKQVLYLVCRKCLAIRMIATLATKVRYVHLGLCVFPSAIVTGGKCNSCQTPILSAVDNATDSEIGVSPNHNSCWSWLLGLYFSQ